MNGLALFLVLSLTTAGADSGSSAKFKLNSLTSGSGLAIPALGSQYAPRGYYVFAPAGPGFYRQQAAYSQTFYSTPYSTGGYSASPSMPASYPLGPSIPPLTNGRIPGYYGGGGNSYQSGGTDTCSIAGSVYRQSDYCQNTGRDDGLRARLKAAGSDCQVPPSPRRIVIGFPGADPGFLLSPLIRGMPGSANNVDFHMFATNDREGALRCAFVLATRPYFTPDGKVVYNSISFVGHSNGGGTAVHVAQDLGKAGVSVDLIVTADPYTQGAPLREARPCNVARLDNYYENNGTGLFQYSGDVVRGANNIPMCSDHLSLPGEGLVRDNTTTALNRLSVCRERFDSATPLAGEQSCGAGLAPVVTRQAASLTPDSATAK
jgi:hypothetical protein